MKWKKLKSLKGLPKDKPFLLYDDRVTSGVHIYEAMMFDSKTMGCPATCEDYDVKDFSHWRPMVKLPKERK